MPTEKDYEHEKLVEQHTCSIVCAVQDESSAYRLLFYKHLKSELEALIASEEGKDDDEG